MSTVDAASRFENVWFVEGTYAPDAAETRAPFRAEHVAGLAARIASGEVAYAGSFAHRIVGVDAATGRVVLNFPHGEYVPVSGDGGRLLLHGYSRLYAVASR